MRENDDVTSGTSGGSLAEGLGETAEPGGGSSASGPFGDGGVDDSYGDSTGSQVDDSYDDAYGDATDGDAGGGFGDGDVADTDATLDPTGSDVTDGVGDGSPGDAGLDGLDVPSQGASPIEGIGYIIDQVREALFGSDDDAAGSVLDADALASVRGAEPADLATEADLDLTGDGVVDHGDLLEAEQPFDFDAGGA
ncbi:MAG TPA: hypothetical protein VFZ79_11170 [Acidimicrobiales bacterium]